MIKENSMIKIDINLKTEIEAAELVSKLSACCENVDLIYGHYIVDAKSILGVLSVAIGKTVTLAIHADEIGDVEDKIRKFIVEKNNFPVN